MKNALRSVAWSVDVTVIQQSQGAGIRFCLRNVVMEVLTFAGLEGWMDGAKEWEGMERSEIKEEEKKHTHSNE